MRLHKFPAWMCETVAKLCERWNKKITALTKEGRKISDIIHFNKGLPQGDALCSRLFTLCINPIAWLLKAPGRRQDYSSVIHRWLENVLSVTKQARQSDEGDQKGNGDRKSTRLNSSHANISYAVFCLKKKKKKKKKPKHKKYTINTSKLTLYIHHYFAL